MSAKAETPCAGDQLRPRPFEPTQNGFVLLPNHRPPGDVKFYEWRNHSRVDGSHDYHRLNGYLSQDNEFVTIWFGLLEPIFLESWFQEKGLELPQYNEELFRGYIDSEEQARHILRALRPHAWLPQVLRSDSTNGIICDILEETKPGPGTSNLMPASASSPTQFLWGLLDLTR